MTDSPPRYHPTTVVQVNAAVPWIEESDVEWKVTSRVDENPYSPPESEPELQHRPRQKSALIAWCVVFAANLPVPFFMSMTVISGVAYWGMTFAILCLLLLSCQLVNQFPRFMQAVRIGGVGTAISQLMPLLHIFLGMFALNLATTIGFAFDQGEPGISSFLGGFFLTTVTAGCLFLVAAAFGCFLQLAYRHASKRKDEG